VPTPNYWKRPRKFIGGSLLSTALFVGNATAESIQNDFTLPSLGRAASSEDLQAAVAFTDAISKVILTLHRWPAFVSRAFHIVGQPCLYREP
jgi:hypothetical protein